MSIVLHLLSYILLTGRRRYSSLTYIAQNRPSKASKILFHTCQTHVCVQTYRYICTQTLPGIIKMQCRHTG